MNEKEIEKLAEGLVEASNQNSPPVDLFEVARGEWPPIEIHGHPFSGDFDGTIRYVESHYVILFNKKYGNEHDPRVRFTIAHELGHYYIDKQRDALKRGKTHKSFIQFETTSHEEQDANAFASALLMPKYMFKNIVNKCQPGWESIEKIAQLGKVSLTATARRFIDLTDHACVLIVSANRRILWFHKSKEFFPYIQGKPLIVPPDSWAGAIFEEGKVPPGFQTINADCWLTGRGVRAGVEILEWSLPINSYGQVLTILWDEKGIAGWQETGYEDPADEDVDWDPPTFHKSKRKR